MSGVAQHQKTVLLTGTAILAALVVIFDYALKFSGLKIPFPWMPMLKFDFTGIPIALSLFLYGLPSAVTTSIVAGVAIFARSGEPIGASTKLIAELTTVLGLALGVNLATRAGLSEGLSKLSSLFTGLAARVLAMSAVNMIVLPGYYGVPYNVSLGMLPLIGAFNAMQGSITILLGYFLYEAYTKRVPS